MLENVSTAAANSHADAETLGLVIVFFVTGFLARTIYDQFRN